MTVDASIDPLESPPTPTGRAESGRAATKKHLADVDTPLLRQHWYVAALSEEITRTLQDRWILERSVLLYRTEAGDAVALSNRCPHRSFPLSKGFLKGDTVVCGYHGLAFDDCGTCVEVPSQQKIPATLKLRRYPVVERPPFVWIWMGDPKNSDPGDIPKLRWLEDVTWAESHGYTHVKANYIRLHENLMDLTHFTYLHPDNVGTPEYALAPFNVSVEGRQVRIDREVKASAAPALYAKPMGIENRLVDRKSESYFASPALHVAKPSISLIDPGDGERSKFKVRYAHAITPASATETHYFWAVARDFAPKDEGATAHLRDSLVKAFGEDVWALEAIEDIDRHDGDQHFKEISVGADSAGNKMRAILQRMAEEEACRNSA